MNNRESLNSLNQETSGRFATFKERMRTMLHGSKLDEVAQTVETAIDTGVDAVLQTITWLQENYRSLFVAISPILLAACATMTDQQPVSAADIQDSLNKQRTGATLELSIEDQEALQAAPTPTPVAVSQQQSGGEKKPTATPIVPEQYVDKQVVYIPAGVNVRAIASTSGALVLNTKGEMRLETTGETAQANGYTWYEVSNPNYNPDDTKSLELVWVAGGATGVKLETVRVQVGIGGGGNPETNQTYEELLALAKQQLGADVADVKDVDGVLQAFNISGNTLGIFVNGGFVTSLPTTVDGVIQEKTVLPEGSSTQTAESENLSQSEQQMRELLPSNFFEVYSEAIFINNIGLYKIGENKFFVPKLGLTPEDDITAGVVKMDFGNRSSLAIPLATGGTQYISIAVSEDDPIAGDIFQFSNETRAAVALMEAIHDYISTNDDVILVLAPHDAYSKGFQPRPDKTYSEVVANVAQAQAITLDGQGRNQRIITVSMDTVLLLERYVVDQKTGNINPDKKVTDFMPYGIAYKLFEYGFASIPATGGEDLRLLDKKLQALIDALKKVQYSPFADRTDDIGYRMRFTQTRPLEEIFEYYRQIK